MRKLVYWCAAAALCAAPSASRAEYESSAFGVEEFGTQAGRTDTCCPGCSDLTYSKNEATSVAGAFDDIGYAQTETAYDEGVDGPDWTDGNNYSWGDDDDDPDATDFADVAFYSGHGTYSCGTGTRWSSIVMGDSDPGDCDIYTHTHMDFGEGGAGEELDVLILSACNTMQYCVWNSDGYDLMRHGSFTTINGFHGLSYDMSSNPDDMHDYIVGAEANGIGDDWVDRFTRFNVSGSFDQCATTMISGSSSANRDNQYNNGGFKDFKATGSFTGDSIYYICSCDPEDGQLLPSC